MVTLHRLRNPLLIVFAALAGICGYWSVRLAWADQLAADGDTAGISQAISLSPGDAAYRVKLANAIEADGGDPAAALTAATALNPSDAQAWIRLGLVAEMHGDFQKAERDLLLAAQVSRQFQPRWTLVNYYCRRNDLEKFWPSVRQALSAGYPDIDPVFALCWKVTKESHQILTRAIPAEHGILSSYLRFLLRENRTEAAAIVAGELVPLAAQADRDVLLTWCSRALQQGQAAVPLSLWNTMCRRSLLPYAPLDPPHGVSLTDGAFAADLDGGFAWHLQPAAGVACGRNLAPRYLWLSFYGTEAEDCEPLAQYLPFQRATRYRLKFEYRTSDMLPESGLHWHVLDCTGADLALGSPSLSSPQWKSDSITFTAPRTGFLARLALRYQHTLGAPRLEGSILLHSVALELIP